MNCQTSPGIVVAYIVCVAIAADLVYGLAWLSGLTTLKGAA